MSLVGNDTESDTESGGQKLFRHSGWKGRTGSMNKRGRKFSLCFAGSDDDVEYASGWNNLRGGDGHRSVQREQGDAGRVKEAGDRSDEAGRLKRRRRRLHRQRLRHQPETPKAEETKTPETAGETATTEETTATESASETTDSEQTETTAPDSETAASKAEKETAGEASWGKAEAAKDRKDGAGGKGRKDLRPCIYGQQDV